MRKAQMMEAIFVAGSVLAGMTGPLWSHAPGLWQRQALIRYELVSQSVHRMMDPRNLCDFNGNIHGPMEAVSRLFVQR